MLRLRGKCSKSKVENNNSLQLRDCHKSQAVSHGKSVMETYETDSEKNRIVPNTELMDKAIVMGKCDFDRLKQKAHVLTFEDRMQMVKEAEKKNMQLMKDSATRKDNLLKFRKPHSLAQGSKLEAVESAAASNNMYLVRRAKDLMIEQDERVKTANSIILATKCKAIRNAQVAEKQLIEQHQKKENQRLDMLMEQERQIKIELEENYSEHNRKKKERYIQDIRQQMLEKEIERLLEANKMEEESKMFNKALITLQKLDEEHRMKEREIKLKLREDFRKANDEAEHLKNLRNEELRMSDLRIQEFKMKKAALIKARDREIAMNKLRKELEIDRLRMQQEKRRDAQAALDETNSIRLREEKEKEWRKKEALASKKKLKANQDLKTARQQQIEDMRRAQAISLSREESDLRKVAEVQKKLIDKDKEELEKRRLQIENHKKELLIQMSEKEKERIKWLQEKFDDGFVQRLERKVKDRNVEEYLMKKINKLREMNVPKHYITDIEKQLQII